MRAFFFSTFGQIKKNPHSMGTNPSPLTTLQLTSPLPSPSATPGRPVIGGDDQALTSRSGNSNNDHNLINAATMSTIEGGGGSGRGRGGVVGNNNDKRNTICLQLPPVVSNIDNDRLVPCYRNNNQQSKNHRRSLPPLVFNPPLIHGDAIYPLANLPTPSMLQHLPFTMPGARGIFEEIDSSDGQVSFIISSFFYSTWFFFLLCRPGNGFFPKYPYNK